MQLDDIVRAGRGMIAGFVRSEAGDDGRTKVELVQQPLLDRQHMRPRRRNPIETRRARSYVIEEDGKRVPLARKGDDLIAPEREEARLLDLIERDVLKIHAISVAVGHIQ